MAMTSHIPVPKAVLFGLGGLAAVAVLGFIFMLGRESARSAPIPVRVEAAPAPAAPAPAQPSPAPVDPPAFAATLPDAPAPMPVARPAAPAAVAAPPAPRTDPDRAAVASYFRTLATIQPAAQGEPEGLAQEVMAGFGKGDTSAFDKMDKQAQETRARLAAVTPPAPCAAFHRETLACMDAGLDLMRGIRNAMAAGDAAALGNLPDRANALKTRSEALKSQETALKHRYCE